MNLTVHARAERPRVCAGRFARRMALDTDIDERKTPLPLAGEGRASASGMVAVRITGSCSWNGKKVTRSEAPSCAIYLCRRNRHRRPIDGGNRHFRERDAGGFRFSRTHSFMISPSGQRGAVERNHMVIRRPDVEPLSSSVIRISPLRVTYATLPLATSPFPRLKIKASPGRSL